MGVRQRGYWLRQADALKRQFIATIGYGVRIGMAESSDYQGAMDELELSEPIVGLKQNAWEILRMLGGGKGV